jgi:hypothetical protein
MSKAGLLATALAVATPALATSALADEPCRARAEQAWARAGAGYLVEAVADGPTCRNAVIVHVVRRPDGVPVWSDVVLADWRFPDEAPRDSTAMEKALAQMLVEGLRSVAGSEQLPEWKQGEEGTLRRGDTVWYAEAGVERAAWNALRVAKRPVFTYLQGTDSIGVLVLGADGSMTKVGYFVP